MTIAKVLEFVNSNYPKPVIKNYVVDGIIKMGWTTKDLNQEISALNILETHNPLYVEVHMFRKK